MFKLAIFDMDGLLIDSEPFWQRAQMEVFKTVNVPITQQMMEKTMGMRVDEVVNHWFRRYPWEDPAESIITDKIVDCVIELVKTEGQSLSGVYSVIELIKSKSIPIAIASSSAQDLINVVVDKLGITEDIVLTCSGMIEDYGKPHPAVFLTTLNKFNKLYNLDIHPEECIVFEDSLNGVIAAKAAKMKCIAVPHEFQLQDKRFNVADRTVASLEEVNTALLEEIFS